MSFIVHVTPDSVANEKKAFGGSTKDVRGRSEYFADRGLPLVEYLSRGRSDSEALAWLREQDLRDCTAVVFEYETYIDSLRFLKAERPWVLRVVRAHNANLPHYLDNFTGFLRMGSPAKAMEAVNTALERFRQDCECADLADYMLAITDWERDQYWGRLTDPAKVVSAPYYLPASFTIERAQKPSPPLCVCFMGANSTMTPLLYDAARNTIDLVDMLDDEFAAWDFVITGNLKPADVLDPLGRMRPTGLLPSPLPMLEQARVVTILSELGMGFKTKILEAIMAGCWVLATPDVYARLPDEVKPWCKSVAVGDKAAFQAALRACLDEPPAGDPNLALKQQAFQALDQVLAGAAPAP